MKTKTNKSLAHKVGTTPAVYSFPALSVEQAKKLFDGLDVNPNTRKDYQSRIKDFIQFAEARGGIYTNIVLDYKNSLGLRITETGALSVSTRNKYITTAKVFLKLLSALFGTPEIGQEVEGYSQTKKHKRTGLNEDQITEIDAFLLSGGKGIKSSRRKALFTLLALQGLRQVEIRRLRISDLNLREQTALIQGKGRDDKERIHLHPQTVEALGEYLGDLKKEDRENGYLFQALGNRKTETGIITTMTIQREIKAVFAALGIEGKTVHGFRHYFVTRLLKDHSPVKVQLYSRHRSIETLQVYNDDIELDRYKDDIFNSLTIKRKTI